MIKCCGFNPWPRVSLQASLLTTIIPPGSKECEKRFTTSQTKGQNINTYFIETQTTEHLLKFVEGCRSEK